MHTWNTKPREYELTVSLPQQASGHSHKPHKPQGRFNVDWDIFVKIFRNVFKLKNLVVLPEKLIDGSERQYPQNKTKILSPTICVLNFTNMLGTSRAVLLCQLLGGGAGGSLKCLILNES